MIVEEVREYGEWLLLKQEQFNDWELKFMESMDRQDYRGLTKPQEESLIKMFDKYCGSQ